MIVKVCGITRTSDYTSLIKAGIRYFGFNFYDKSPRYLSNWPENFSKSDDIFHIGVFVNSSPDYIRKQCKAYKLDYIQLHGDESLEFCKNLSLEFRTIKVFGISNPEDFDQALDYEFCDYLLFDTKTTKRGGSGKKFSWEILENYNGSTPFILAGGIQADDYKKIKKIIHPRMAGIDINSGFETSPGLKDPDKIKIFIDRFNRLTQ